MGRTKPLVSKKRLLAKQSFQHVALKMGFSDPVAKSDLRRYANKVIVAVGKKHMWQWRKFRPDVVAVRKKKIREADTYFRDGTVVTRSSVSSVAGQGLYSLKTYDSGTVLPFVYPGKRLSKQEHDELNLFLVAQTHKTGTEQDRKGLPDILSVLRERWGITLASDRRGWTFPDWDHLYDTFVAYRFGVSDGKACWCWPLYEWSGDIRALDTTPSHAALFINEPADAHKFVNRLSMKERLSVANVESFEKPNGEIGFRALRKISRFDEFLMYYGDKYARSYETNKNLEECKMKTNVFRCKSINKELLTHQIHKLSR